MKITKLSRAEQEVVRSNDSLRRYLQALEQGRKPTPHSWLYEHEDAAVTLTRWKHILMQLQGKSEMYDKIYQFDLKQESKFGQQGGVPPIKEAIEVESFQEQYELSDVRISPKRTLNKIFTGRVASKTSSVGYRSVPNVINDMRERDTLVTNSGWPAFARRETQIELAQQHLNQRSGVNRAFSYPAIILFRQYNGKLRVVWMFPLEMNLLEYKATQPLQEFIQKNTKYVMPWRGFEDVKRRFTELWDAHPYAFGGDTTAMDAHMQTPQLTAVADACESLFADPKLMRDTLLHVADINIVVGEDAIIADQLHGIASGSGWTQLSETIFQILKFDEFIQRKNLPLTIEDGMGIGDDYVWFFDQKPDSEEIVEFWQEDGLPGKAEKQSNEDDSCTFLQRLFLKGYMSREDKQVLGGVYPTIRALNSLLWPEKFHDPKKWNSDMFCIRTYMILENCVDHPLFEEFVRFVVNGQKDLLPFAKKSAEELERIQQTSRLIPGLNPSYNQEKRDKPLGSFESIKYASAL